jgi:maltose O-acetyltransferase
MKKFVKKILEYLRGEPQHIGKLYKRGLKVGKNFCRMGGVIIDPTHCYHITIGDNVTLAPRVHILAHDASTFIFMGKTRAANVKIGNDVFIGASTIVLPGVTIGNRVIVGAGSVVTKDIPDNVVAVGNPCRVLRPIGEKDREYYFKDRKLELDKI